MGKRERLGKKIKFNSVVIATFSAWRNNKRTPTNGMIEPLLSFFKPISKEVTLIDAPHPGSDNIIPIVEIYLYNKLFKKYHLKHVFPPFFILKRFNSLKTQPVFKVRDFFSVFQTIFPYRQRVDLFIGLESVFTLAGIILKKLGKINKVVYYVSDYSPHRYQSSLFNKIYLWLDRICCYHADYIWDVSTAMMPARIKNGLNKEKSACLIHVPNALFPWQITYKKEDELEPYSLAFAGTIGPENGLDLAIEALNIAKTKLPGLKLHIFGGGLKEDEELAKELIVKYKLEKSVFNYGFVSDLKTLSKKLSSCMVGLAPYRAMPNSVRWYADATKMRLYFGSGMPVITTKVPPLGAETAQKGCSIVVNDEKKELAEAILKLFSSRILYKRYRENAVKFAQKNTWENSYENALRQMK